MSTTNIEKDIMNGRIFWSALYSYLSLNQRKLYKRSSLLNSFLLRIHRGRSRAFCRSDGSITVEAVLCVPVFFLVTFSLFYLINVQYEMGKIQSIMSNAVSDYAAYGTKSDTITGILNSGKMIKWDEEGEYGVCYVDYRQNIPFLGGRLVGINIYQQMVINDYSGKSMQMTEKENEVYVYITDNGTVYHYDSQCSYLRPSIQNVLLKNISSKRNVSGGKYYPCEACYHSEIEDNHNVFITNYGNRYHSKRNCPGLKRNIHRMRLSELSDMPACSRCGGKLRE